MRTRYENIMNKVSFKFLIYIHMTVKKKTTIDALKDTATKKNPAKSVKKKEKQSEFVLSVSKAIDSKEMEFIIHINCP